MSPVLVFVIVLAALVVAIGVLVASRFKVAGPNEAFIVTGRKGRAVTNPETGAISTDLSGQKVVMGASTFVLPVVQKLAVLDLSSRQIGISVGSAVSAQGIRCSLEGVAIVKVGGTEDAVRAAAQRFLGQQGEIDPFTQEVLAGSLRAIVGRLSVEEIVEGPRRLRPRGRRGGGVVAHEPGPRARHVPAAGHQDRGQLPHRPRPSRGRSRREGSGDRRGRRPPRSRAGAHQGRGGDRDPRTAQLNLRKASIQAETDAAAAQALAAGPLAKAAKDQEVIAAQELVAERMSGLKERELDTEVRKPADAERYAVEQKAEADKTKRVREAEAGRIASIEAAQAKAEEDRLVGAGERQRREELAKALELEGMAQGAAERAAAASPPPRR